MRRAHFSHCNALALFTCKPGARTQSTTPQAPPTHSTSTRQQQHHTSAPPHQHATPTAAPDHNTTAPDHRNTRPPLHTTSARAPHHYNTILRQRTPTQHQSTRPQQDHSTGRATQQHTTSTPKRHRQATPQHRQTTKHTFGASAADRHMHRDEKRDIFIFRPWTTGQGRNLKTHIL